MPPGQLRTRPRAAEAAFTAAEARQSCRLSKRFECLCRNLPVVKKPPIIPDHKKADSPPDFPKQALGSLIQECRDIRDGGAYFVTRRFRRAVASGPCFGGKGRERHRRLLLSSRFMTAARVRTRLCSGAWGFRPFAIGSSGLISVGRTALSTASRPGIPRSSMTTRGARSSAWSRPVRPRDPWGRALEADRSRAMGVRRIRPLGHQTDPEPRTARAGLSKTLGAAAPPRA